MTVVKHKKHAEKLSKGTIINIHNTIKTYIIYIVLIILCIILIALVIVFDKDFFDDKNIILIDVIIEYHGNDDEFILQRKSVETFGHENNNIAILDCTGTGFAKNQSERLGFDFYIPLISNIHNADTTNDATNDATNDTTNDATNNVNRDDNVDLKFESITSYYKENHTSDPTKKTVRDKIFLLQQHCFFIRKFDTGFWFSSERVVANFVTQHNTLNITNSGFPFLIMQTSEMKNTMLDTVFNIMMNNHTVNYARLYFYIPLEFDTDLIELDSFFKNLEFEGVVILNCADKKIVQHIVH